MPDRLDILTNEIPEILFGLEEALLSLPEKPIYAARRIVSSLKELVGVLVCDAGHRDLCVLSKRLYLRLERSLSMQSAWSSSTSQLLAYWVTEFRSQYLHTESFYLVCDLEELSRVTSLLLDEVETKEDLDSKHYRGEYQGDLKDFEQGLELLSELGFWSIQSCFNSTERPSEMSFVRIRASVSLVSIIPLADVQHQFGGAWQWVLKEEGALSISNEDDASYRKILSYLKRLVIEREAWRHTAGLGRLFSDMESDVGAYAVRLDSLYRFSRAIDLLVMPRGNPSIMPEGGNSKALLIYGKVCVMAGSELITHELAVSLLPVFKVTVNGRALVIPAYMASICDQNGAEDHLRVSFNGDGWQIGDVKEALPVLDVWRGHDHYLLIADSVERTYATPVRADALPDNVLNVWSIRGALIEERRMLDSNDVDILHDAQRCLMPSYCLTPVSTVREQVKLHECAISEGARLWVVSGFVRAMLPNDAHICFDGSMLLVDDALVPVLNPQTLLVKGGIFIVIKVGGVMLAAHCRTIDQVHIELFHEPESSVSERFIKWKSGEQKDLRITCEADVFALHSELLEAL